MLSYALRKFIKKSWSEDLNEEAILAPVAFGACRDRELMLKFSLHNAPGRLACLCEDSSKDNRRKSQTPHKRSGCPNSRLLRLCLVLFARNRRHDRSNPPKMEPTPLKAPKVVVLPMHFIRLPHTLYTFIPFCRPWLVRRGSVTLFDRNALWQYCACTSDTVSYAL